MPIPISEVNQMDQPTFLERFGGIFEHSPWVAERAFAQKPFTSLHDLYGKMCEAVQDATDAEKLALIRAHPDLGERVAALTESSAREQVAAGLGQLTPKQQLTLQERNTAYKKTFGFPFVICARLNDKDAILHALDYRLRNKPSVEIATALSEIDKIASLRLHDLVVDA